jgi:hypothetical protein
MLCLRLRFFIYFFFDFRKNKCWNEPFRQNPAAAGVPAATRHDVRGGANGHLPCQVGSDFCHRGARRRTPAAVGHDATIPAAVGPRRQESCAGPHGGRVLAPWAMRQRHPYIRGRSLPPPALPHSLPPLNLRLSTFRSTFDRGIVNTKNWYRKETDLWAEFGKEISFGRRFSLKHSVRALAVGSTPSFGRSVVLRLEEEVFGDT